MPTAAEDRPNVLFVLTDDQQFDALGCMGNTSIRTPNLDRLAARGTLFERAYIMGGDTPAVCCPSRAMIHTGRSLWRTGGSKNVPADYPTMAETFRSAGYRTFATGKQHNGVGAVARGFTDAGKLLFAGMGHHMQLSVQDHDPTGAYDPARAEQVPRYSTEMFTDAACDFLEHRSTADPFFCYVAFTAPHDPIMVPEPFASMVDPTALPLPATFRPEHPDDHNRDGDRVRGLQSCDECTADAVVKYHKWPIDAEDMRTLLAGYYGMISHLDAQVGRLLDVLERRGELDRTLIVFASDNGIAMGRHGCYHKQTSYDHDAHIPLILAGPGIPQGERRDAMVYLFDLFPTLCDRCGLPCPDTVEGESFSRSIDDAATAAREHLYHAYTQNWRAVQDGRHRLVICADHDRESGQTSYARYCFDLHADPDEADNRIDDPAMADVVARLMTLLKEQRHAWSDPAQPGGFWDGLPW